MELVQELWRRALSPTPVPQPATVAIIGAVAMAAVVFAWPLMRTLVTICHEAGHASAALLVGRKLSGIRVHSDTSGLTLTKGRPDGVGMVFTFFAGYPSAALVGLGVAWLAGAGYAAGALWLIVALLALMLLKIRNFYGALVVLAVGALIAAVSWFAAGGELAWLAYGLGWMFLLAAPRPVLELVRNRSSGSDAGQLASLTGVPRLVWIGLWLVITVGALVLGASMLIP